MLLLNLLQLEGKKENLINPPAITPTVKIKIEAQIHKNEIGLFTAFFKTGL